MYIVDFVKNLFKKNNVGILIWLVLNTALMTIILGFCFSDAFSPDVPAFVPYLIGAVVYIATVIVALSPIGELILRLQNGCRKIKRQDYLQRLTPLFNEVYSNAKAVNPELPDNIQFYMSNDAEPNAFATGRKTVCITEGMMNASDDEIKAVLGHEFGHLAHKDTDAILVVSVGNLIVSAIFVIWRIFFNIFARFVNICIGIAAQSLGAAIAGIITRVFIDFVLVIAMRLWTELGALLCLHASRKNEYRADEYSFNMGYGYNLCAFLDKLDPSSKSNNGLWATLNASHPSTHDRIAHLQELGCSYRKY